MPTLRDQIADFQQQSLSRMPAELLETLRADTRRLVQSDVVAQALSTGRLAPSFELSNAVGAVVRSEDLLRQGPLVINFYRGAWCPYCNLELRALQEALPAIHAAGAQLVAISPNRPDKSLTSIEKHGLQFEVLTDAHNQLARQYGLVITLDETVRSIYLQIGFDVPDHNGDDTWEIPMPATYVVTPNDEIVFSFVSADYTQRAEPQAILAALTALKVR